jgi:hypothetical protein
MMYVEVESIDQKMLLETGALTTFLTLKLPDGSRVSTQIESEVAQALINIAAQKEYKDTPREEPSLNLNDLDMDDSVSEIFSASEATPEPDDNVSWADLPEEHLSTRMKGILTNMGTAPVLPMSSLVTLVDQLTEDMLNAKAAQQAQVGVVQRPSQLRVTRAKTVPKDAYGYPVVPGSNDRDPGEVAQADTDEDGVPQL